MKDTSPKIIKRARRLRQCETKTEGIFWQRVRDSRIGGFKIRRQVPIAVFVVDFACLSERLIIEIDGGVHNNPRVQERDQIRDKKLQSLGYRILRFGDGAVVSDLEAVVWLLQRELKEGPTDWRDVTDCPFAQNDPPHPTAPHPNPSPHEEWGEGILLNW